MQVRAHVDFPPDVLSDDPQLRVTWTLSRDDTRETIASTSDRKLAADVALAGEDRVPPVTLSCTVRRVLATGTRTIYSTSRPVVDRGLIDRSRPYVRWLHHSVVQWVDREPDGSLTRQDLVTLERPSVIHRTDVPGGCLFVEPQGSTSGVVEYSYLDALPFPTADLAAHRTQLCDYCFFGGPTRTEPRPLPA